MTLQEFLGEAFARFELGRSPGWAEHAPTAPIKFVDDTESERQFRTNDCQVWLQSIRQLDDGIQAFEIRGKAFGLVANAAISRGAVQLRNPRRSPQLPHQRMLAPTAT